MSRKLTSAEREARIEADRAIVRHANVRNYRVAALASLVFVFGILFGQGSDAGGLIAAAFGVAGVFLRWTAAPIMVIVVTVYFTLFPAGIPELGYSSSMNLARGIFRLEDIVLTSALAVYTLCQYRLFGLLVQAMPAHEKTAKSSMIRRPPDAIAKSEFASLIRTAIIITFAGQVAWWLLLITRVEPSHTFPLSTNGEIYSRTIQGAGSLSPPATRFVLLAGVALLTAILAQIVFGYWRLRLLRPGEARMMLQDIGWNENRREYSRIATWRAWARKRIRHKTPKKPGGTP